MDYSLTAIPQNFRKQVDWILGTYSDSGVSLCDGFQKDAIQNAMGARLEKKFKNWTCSLSFVKNDKGSFIVVEDTGTAGLTGPNLKANEINTLVAQKEIEGKSFDAEWRLVRFSSMNNSGDNKTGGGLYGVGKSVFAASSTDCIYYFDSLTSEGKYVANMNKQGLIQDGAFEDDAAKQFIYNETGLQEKTTIGTRIIITNPKAELIDGFVTGEIITDIQRTWWLLMKRMGDDSGIFVDGQKVEQFSEDAYTHSFEKDNISYENGYTIKHFGFFINEKQDVKFPGISYYRKGMRIGEIEQEQFNIPDRLQGKWWGYVEVDEKWENELASIEDRVHNGISKGKKRTMCYQVLKRFVRDYTRNQLISWGYIKEQKDEYDKLNEKLNSLASDLQHFFSNEGFEDLGVGPHKDAFDVRLLNVTYPKMNSLRVTDNDHISFDFKITNTKHVDCVFSYKTVIIEKETKEEKNWGQEEEIKVLADDFAIGQVDFCITSESAFDQKINLLSFDVGIKGNKTKKNRQLEFTYNCEDQKPDKDIVSLSLSSCVFPRKNSRRVNFGEFLTNVEYRIENRRNGELPYRLNVSLHDCTDPSNPKMYDVFSFDGKVKPYEEATVNVGSICFEEEKLSKYMNKGQIELRARLIANKDSDLYEKGDKLTDYKLKIYLNCDEKHGLENAFSIKMKGNNDKPYLRSWCEVSGDNRTIYINNEHTAYYSVSGNEESEMEYLREQALKQVVLLYMKEGKLSKFAKTGDNFNDLDPETAVEHVEDLIEQVNQSNLM